MRASPWFSALAILMLVAELLAYEVCRVAGTSPFSLFGLVCLAGAAIVTGGAATLLFERLVLHRFRQMADQAAASDARAEEAVQVLADRVEQHRRVRHDLRGALSPVLLIADRLLNHADPAVGRSAGILVRTVDRATTLLADASGKTVSPPADP